MIQNFVEVSLKDDAYGPLSPLYQTQNSLSLGPACSSRDSCTPYIIKVSKGVYQFECWGSTGMEYNQATPGRGAYTKGIIVIHEPTRFYVYVGRDGFFNAVKELGENIGGIRSGGATDVRINTSDNWWDTASLISRIMVAAGGGGSEWGSCSGGNGGELNGGDAVYDNGNRGTCPGASQTSGSECEEQFVYGTIGSEPAKGEFGSGGVTKSSRDPPDYGGFGGGGYYGGTSVAYGWSGSGGSSFISGHKGCDAVENQLNIKHTGNPFHYSDFVFTKTVMKAGNTNMPLPDSNKQGIWEGKGAFRITLLIYQYHCTHKRNLPHISFVLFLKILIS